MLKKLIPIIPIGLSIFVVALVLICAVFVKSETVVLVNPPIVNNDVTPPVVPPVIDDDIDTSDWEVYHNEEFGFEIKYPKDWKVSIGKHEPRWHETVLGNIVISGSAEDRFYAPISITIRNNEERLSIKEWYEKNYPNGDVSRLQEVKFGETKGMRKLSLRSNGINSFYFSNEDKIYSISPLDSQENVENQREMMEKMLSTFKFIESIDTSDWKVYHNERYGYEIKYPLDWIIETYEEPAKNAKKPIRLAFHTKDKQKIEGYQESLMASVNVAVINKSSEFTVEDYLRDFGYDLNPETIKDGRILRTRGIAETWMRIKKENFKGNEAYVIQTLEDFGYYLYFEYNQNIYEITSLYRKKEISKEKILGIIYSFKFTNQ